MSKHYFFYDESEHSRKISYKTVSALNYYDNFIAMIVGWNDSKDDILQRYLVFETAYTDRKDRKNLGGHEPEGSLCIVYRLSVSAQRVDTGK